MASGRSSVVRTSGRPWPAVIRTVAVLRQHGHAEDDRVLDGRDLLDAQAGGRRRAGRHPGRDRDVRGRPHGLARDDDEARPEGVRVHVDRRRGRPGSRSGRPPARSSRVCHAPARWTSSRRRRNTRGRWSLVLELVVAIDPPVDSQVAGRSRSRPRCWRRRRTRGASWRAGVRCGSPVRTSAGRATAPTIATRPATSSTAGIMACAAGGGNAAGEHVRRIARRAW